MHPEIKIKKGFQVNTKNFYVYLHFKEDTGEVFYVGKGTKMRWCNVYSRTLHWKNTAAKHGVVCKLAGNSLTESEALVLEKKLIELYGRQDQKTGCLVNLTSGGDGVVNYIFTDEHRRKLSEIGKDRVHTEDSKAKIRQANLGRTFSSETIKRMSDARKGKPFTEKQRQALLVRGNSRSCKIICVETGVIYESLSLAGKAVGVGASEVSKVCKGKKKTMKGFSWKYFEEEINLENAA